jgi:hypothetical protein
MGNSGVYTVYWKIPFHPPPPSQCNVGKKYGSGRKTEKGKMGKKREERGKMMEY